MLKKKRTKTMTVGMIGPDDLDGVVAVELLGQDVVAGLAPVADDGVEDEALDADEDDRRQARTIR